jgi:transcription elongation factor SPT5
MADVFSMDIGPRIRLKPGDFVRINFGTYKNDLAQVVSLEEHIGKVIVRVVPRLDTSGNKRVRPPSKLFNPQDYPSCDRKRDLSTQETYYSLHGSIFKGGLLHKSLALRSLRADEIKPTLTEIKNFEDGKFDLCLKSKKILFTPGDKVKVTKGDSKGLRGSVDSSDGFLVFIYPFDEDFCDKRFEFSVFDLCKYFEVGDHVKVIEGRYVGITGMVVAWKDETVDFIADINRSIYTVLANDLKLSEEISAGQDKSEDFRVNEIIVLKNEISFGIITKLTSGGVLAVLDNGETENVWLHDISKRFSRKKFWALDRDNNKIGFNDMVKVVFSKHPYFNKVGSVKNAFRGVVFIQIADYLEQVIIAAKSSFCMIQGSNSEEKELQVELKGAVVRLKSGPYRGYSGKVIEISDSRLKIELSTVSKIVDVELSACEKVEEVRELMTIHEQKRTPAVHSPAYTPNYQSPFEGQGTPPYSRMY